MHPVNSLPHAARLPALDGLRAVSILLVLFSHAWLGHLIPGGLGVTIFFFISGYIITRLMISETRQYGALRLRQFYLRRVFRLMPALLVFVVAALLVMACAGVVWQWQELASVFFYFANYFAIFIGYSGEVLPPPLSITWSLAVEEHFYMVFPFLFLALIAKPRRFLACILSLLVLVLAWRVYLVYGVGLDQLVHYRIYKATDTRADSILYGTALALIEAYFPRVQGYLQRPALAALGVLLLLATLVFRDEAFRESYRYSLQGIALLCLFSYAVLQPTRVQACLAAPLMLYIGRISYSLYLYHWLVFGMMTVWLPPLALPLRVAIMLAASLLLADLSCRWVEQPGLALGRRLLR
ncbi:MULTISPECIES: acyltransferase [unclassified Undibacterium]|uniref:acyltransferase family protein n=1 Tax=unclassified Undibacterium TaxID=2630295 RepID=UPI002AC9E960|nr:MULTISPECIES: acyltransferase [unclassified Undibacterium]MEB0138469.1 acyltransferase [Undibacterium sp. CCC2.1]MEB0173131.1 acyltransferase [Undibacterium sp. CCC1.1]MEB0177521.1 acyltransferase [Undibacterium sp. CCC3.4]MEB0216163.1 acyltransferase [Undibacterium sp. 5I2]WPX42788.1 acyltransferase [Undibacterium sp. CCC3.4]